MKPDLVACFLASCKVLELPSNPVPSVNEIKKIRRILSKKFHPDLHQNTPHKVKEYEEITKSINAACDFLLKILHHPNLADLISKAKESSPNQNGEARHSNTNEKNEDYERADPEREARRRAKRKEKARSKELRKSFSRFERLAKKGIAEAQYRLAVFYKNGQGCIRNKIKALRWFKKAAAAGEPRASLYVGFAFAWGIDISIDLLKAIKLYNEAAEKNLPEAYFQLGLMYYFGFGVKQEFENAVKLYHNAIELGYKITNQVTETCGHFKTELPKEYPKYFRWYLTAVQRVTFD
jgi:TPR repeat protein